MHESGKVVERRGSDSHVQPEPAQGRVVSVITPAYNEAENIPLMYERLVAVFASLPHEWEWVVVDDHSSDRTFSVLEDLAAGDSRIRAYRLARNSGSHTAIACALSFSRGDCCVATLVPG